MCFGNGTPPQFAHHTSFPLSYHVVLSFLNQIKSVPNTRGLGRIHKILTLTLVSLLPEPPQEVLAEGAERGLPEELGQEVMALDLVHPEKVQVYVKQRSRTVTRPSRMFVAYFWCLIAPLRFVISLPRSRRKSSPSSEFSDSLEEVCVSRETVEWVDPSVVLCMTMVCLGGRGFPWKMYRLTSVEHKRMEFSSTFFYVVSFGVCLHRSSSFEEKSSNNKGEEFIN